MPEEKSVVMVEGNIPT